VSRVVTHVTQGFLSFSEAWLYDIVTAPVPYEARVLTRRRENEEQFPFGRVELIAYRNPRGSPRWFHHQLHQRLGWPRRPANLWRDSLRELAGGSTLFHAHYGWVGWYGVDAGLAPTVTSFYGADASDAATLAEWGSAYRGLFRAGAAFVAEGAAMRERLVALGAPPERTHVIPLVAPLPDDWEPATPVDGQQPRILMTGRFVDKKGFADGIAAFARVLRAGGEARLVLMGAGPDEALLRATVRAEGVEDAAEFLPPQPRERFREVVRSCHILLQPSRTAGNGDAEGGAPATLLEAQALGRVIVATDHADIPHVVSRDAAFLSREGDVDALAESLTRALRAPDEWSARGTAGRRFVAEHHGRDHVGSLLERLYDGVVADA
jgi:colanic acid/amylovoran/stewartan biosynthesis glycosyltransferase WcaL/AmsK/CpsK